MTLGNNHMNKTMASLIALTMLSGCGSVGKLKNVGKTPKMTEVQPVETAALERSIGQSGAARLSAAPSSATLPAAPTASLFRAGAGSFLGDQRASRKGDILTIRIAIDDRAQVDNNTSRTRGGSESAGLNSLLGIEKLLPNNGADIKASANSSSKSEGGGNISRSETINMTMSAVVTDVMPNGNLIVKGRQEVRVNYELRELVVTGLVRPQDVARDNSVPHSNIAEARISYSGKGQISDAQQARWGQQIYDALFPF